MAKIVAEFDTITKMITVNIDGVPFEDCCYVTMDTDCDDTKYCAVLSRKKDMTNGTTQMTRICAASDRQKLVAGETLTQSAYAGMYEEKPRASVSDDVLKWFKGIQ